MQCLQVWRPVHKCVCGMCATLRADDDAALRLALRPVDESEDFAGRRRRRKPRLEGDREERQHQLAACHVDEQRRVRPNVKPDGCARCARVTSPLCTVDLC
jgi:hypothetical protein